ISKGQAGIAIQNVSSRSVLTMGNITEDRYGNYTCVAFNKLGTANASLSLIRGVRFKGESETAEKVNSAGYEETALKQADGKSHSSPLVLNEAHQRIERAGESFPVRMEMQSL
ncbi:neuronal growth regulator 1 isoform X1, partial [Tachysurus ichikawai]